jgi:thiamine biosynthesis lipoprotein
MSAGVATRGSEPSVRGVAIPTVLNHLHLPAPGAFVQSIGGETMGTTWSVRFVATSDIDPGAVQSAVEQVLQGVVDEMSTWLETSALSQFNRTAGEWMELPADLTTVLACALATARDTRGAYDPTIGPLVDLWGFGPAGTRVNPPSHREINAARARVGWPRVELDVATRRARKPGGTAIDLSAIAKGFAVDVVAVRLAALGVTSHLVEVGGELRGLGLKPDAHPWWVAVERPVDVGNGTDIDLLVALHDLSVATSGDYRRRFNHDGCWYSHTIDPRTGWPVTHGLASVAVLHREALVADALSTALMVLGVEDGLTYAAGRDVAALCLERTASGLTAHASPALEAMLR